MPVRRLPEDVIHDLQMEVEKLSNDLKQSRNRKQIIVPIWDADTIPTTFPDGIEGQVVIGDNNALYVWKNGSWEGIGTVLPKPDGYAEIDTASSGETTIVTNPNAGLRIQLINYYLIADDAVVVEWISDTGGASLSGEKALQQGTGWVAPLGYWEMTDADENLILKLSAAIQVSGFVVYRYTADGLD